MKDSTRRRLISGLWLTLVWVMLWGTWSVANLLSGLLVALVINVFFTLPSVEFRSRLHPLGVVRLMAAFALDLCKASVLVAAQALRPRLTTNNSVIGVSLRSQSDLVNTLTIEALSLIPGSIVIEFNQAERVLYAHVWGTREAVHVDEFRDRVLELEQRVIAAIDPAGER